VSATECMAVTWHAHVYRTAYTGWSSLFGSWSQFYLMHRSISVSPSGAPRGAGRAKDLHRQSTSPISSTTPFTTTRHHHSHCTVVPSSCNCALIPAIVFEQKEVMCVCVCVCVCGVHY
jgi:hypothetical protein